MFTHHQVQLIFVSFFYLHFVSITLQQIEQPFLTELVIIHIFVDYFIFCTERKCHLSFYWPGSQDRVRTQSGPLVESLFHTLASASKLLVWTILKYQIEKKNVVKSFLRHSHFVKSFNQERILSMTMMRIKSLLKKNYDS